MKIVDVKITGNLVIDSDSQYNSLQAGAVTVTEYVTARLYGSIKKDLIIKKAAKVYLHASVEGRIRNEGGTVYIFDSEGNVITLGDQI